MDNVTETFISVLFYKIKCGPSMRAQAPKRPSGGPQEALRRPSGGPQEVLRKSSGKGRLSSHTAGTGF